jgi:hypothetical protein
MHAQKRESIQDEVLKIIDWLRNLARPPRQSDRGGGQQSRPPSQQVAPTNDGRRDPPNALFWSWPQREDASHYRRHGQNPRRCCSSSRALLDPKLEKTQHPLPRPDTSFVICPKNGGGIECALHSTKEQRLARFAPQFADMGRRMNVGTRIARASISAQCRLARRASIPLGYNHGLSSWSWSDIITHENGKRQIVTFFKKANGETKWRA